MKKLVAILCVMAALVVGAVVANGQGTLEDAKNFVTAGKYAQAEAVLQARVVKNSQDAESFFNLAICSLKQGKTSDEAFLKAVGIEPKYNDQVGITYFTEAGKFLSGGNTEIAIRFYDFAIKWDPKLLPNIAQNLFDSGKYDLAVKYDAKIGSKVAALYWANADAQGIEKGLPLYREAKKYSDKRNGEIKQKLLAIAKSKFEEKDIAFWRAAAAEFGEIPPDDKVYQPGTYTFSLKAGQKLDHWIMFPEGELINYSLKSGDYGYKLLYNDGQIVKDGENVIYPNKVRDKFKIIAITDQSQITMTVVRGKLSTMVESH